MKVICFSGVDGAGKSTQASLLYVLLQRLGFRVRYLWLRWFAFITYPLYLYARLTKRTITVQRGRHQVKVHAWWVDPVLRTLYPYAILLDTYLWYLVNRVVSRLCSMDFLIVDRSIIDTVVDVVWEVRSTRFMRGLVGRLLASFLREAAVVVMIATPRTVARRKSDIISLSEIQFKKRCYEIIAKHLSLPVVDTSEQTVLATFRQILKLVRC